MKHDRLASGFVLGLILVAAPALAQGNVQQFQPLGLAPRPLRFVRSCRALRSRNGNRGSMRSD
jgi:hypothetical protein